MSRKLYSPKRDDASDNIKKAAIAKEKAGREKSEGSIPPHLIRFKQIYKLVCELERKLVNSITFDSRMELLVHYDELIKIDCRVAIKFDIFGRKWKHLVHSLIKENRRNFSKFDTGSKQAWNEYMNAVADRYSEHLRENSNELGPKIVAKTLIYLGDIHRYIGLYFVDGECEKFDSINTAETFYMASLVVIPNDGHVRSLLGLCCLLRNQQLEAASWYFLSINCKSPFQGAEDSLMELFSQISDKSRSLDFENHSLSILGLQILYSLFAKIDVDLFPQRLETFEKELKRFGNSLFEANSKDTYRWWFSFGIVSVSTCSKILHSSHDGQTKEMLLNYWSNLMCTVFNEITKCFGNQYSFPNSFLLFSNAILEWAIRNQVIERFTLPNILTENVSLISNVSIILESSIEFPEDALLKDTGNLDFKRGTSSTITMECLRFEYSYDNNERLIRFNDIVGYLAFTNPIIFSAPSSSFTEKKITEPNVKSDGIKEINFEDLDDSLEAEMNFETLESDSDNLGTEESIQNTSEDLKSLKLQKSRLLSAVNNNEMESVKHLIFDTNCWLSNSKILKEIIMSQKRDIIVPVTGTSF